MRCRSTLALILTLLLLPAGLLAVAGCSSSNPVEPAPDSGSGGGSGGGGGGGGGGGDGSGTFLIELSMTPAEVPIGGSATLALQVTNRTGGAAPANGSQVTLNTNLGYFEVNNRGAEQQSISVSLVGGAGQTPFFGGDSTGSAEIIALFDDSTSSLAVTLIEPEAPPFFASALSPDVGSGQGGQRVQIQGTGFTEPTQVTFAGALAQVRSVSPTVIEVTTPPAVPALTSGGSRRVDVVVSIDVQTSAPRSTTLPGAYIYTAGGGSFNQPAVFSVAPTQGPNAGGTQVTITGEGFETDARVFFGFANGAEAFDGIQATDVVSRSDRQIVVRTPAATGAGQALLNQTVDLQVENPRTGLFGVLLDAFRYGSGGGGGGIVVSGISPRRASYTGLAASGSPVSISLLGQNFGTDPTLLSISLAGVAQTRVLQLNSTGSEITFDLSAAPVSGCAPPSGPAVVTNTETGESGQSDFDFTYTVEEPALSGLSPSATTSDGGIQPVTLTGSALQGDGASGEAVRVTFGGVRGTVQGSATATSVTVTPPAFTGSFEEEACDENNDGVAGVRDAPTTVDVVFTNLVNGCSDSLPQSFTYNPPDTTCVESETPVADFRVSNIEDLLVRFDNRSTGGNIYFWDFDDGNSSSAEDPVHEYAEAGTYQVTLRVENSAGLQDQVTRSVTVPEGGGVSPGGN